MSYADPIVLTPADEHVVINALRYARGRATYVAEEMCSFVAAHWHQLSDNTKAVIARDVRIELDRRHNDTTELGTLLLHQIPHWERLLDTIEKEGIDQ